MRSAGGAPLARPNEPLLDLSRERLLVIDADLGKRLAARLRDRGRRAVWTGQIGLADGVKDPEVLRGLVARYGADESWVLVTGDDKMPAEHGPVLTETRATVATIDGIYPAELTEYEWRTDVVQRWAHSMQLQPPNTVRRYSDTGSKVWRPRRRHIHLIRKHGWEPWTPQTDAQGTAA
jgi:hypothetical protein